MLEELQRRNYSQTTGKGYLKIVEAFAKYFHRSPDRLGPEQIRAYQVYLFTERKLNARTPDRRFSQDEAVRLIDAANNLFHRATLMTVYSTEMRRAEMCQLKVEDIDSDRMLIHIRQGKGRRDRDVPLSPKLLETLRQYWLWMRPQTYLFQGTVNGSRADKPITAKMLWEACREALITVRILQSRLVDEGTVYEVLRDVIEAKPRSHFSAERRANLRGLAKLMLSEGFEVSERTGKDLRATPQSCRPSSLHDPELGVIAKRLYYLSYIAKKTIRTTGLMLMALTIGTTTCRAERT